MRKAAVLLLAILVTISCKRQNADVSRPASNASTTPQPARQFTEAELKTFSSLEPVDTHTHVFRQDPSFQALLNRLHLHILDILYLNDHDDYLKDLHPALDDILTIVHANEGRVHLCTSFSPYKFNEPHFTDDAIRQLNENFSQGAVAVKIWKTLGMEVKNSKGQYVLPDDPALEPIYRDIADHNKTLIAHLAEPDSCWQPPNPADVDYSYYQHHPEWYMYRHPDVPSKKQILEARDHLLQQNPKLRVVGAHLGSMEDSLDDIAERFDRYPNFAVDTAARVPHLMVQPSDKVRAFILKYQDRILYATDLEFLPKANPKDVDAEWEDQYALDWRYFSTSATFDFEGHRVQGLDLPESVLRKLYHDNAAHWIPGVLTGNPSAATRLGRPPARGK